MTATLTRPWHPGQGAPRDTIAIPDDRQLLLVGIERRIRTLFGEGRTLRRILHSRPDEAWLQDLYLGLIRDRRQLAALFATRRQLRGELGAGERKHQ